MSELTTKQSDLLLLLLDEHERPAGRSIGEMHAIYREVLREMESDSESLDARGRVIGWDHGGIRQTLMRMEARGLVRREYQSSRTRRDRREPWVSWWITDAGYEALWPGEKAVFGQTEGHSDG